MLSEKPPEKQDSNPGEANGCECRVDGVHPTQVTLCTAVENQPVALIEVYEGESAAARENAVVATVTLPLVPAPFGSPNILVRDTAAMFTLSDLHLSSCMLRSPGSVDKHAHGHCDAHAPVVAAGLWACEDHCGTCARTYRVIKRAPA